MDQQPWRTPPTARAANCRMPSQGTTADIEQEPVSRIRPAHIQPDCPDNGVTGVFIFLRRSSAAPAIGDAVFVVTHRVPTGWPHPEAPFPFVSDGLPSAIAQAFAGTTDPMRDGHVDPARERKAAPVTVPLVLIVVSSPMARVGGVSPHVRVATSNDAQTIAEIHLALLRDCSDADPNPSPPPCPKASADGPTADQGELKVWLTHERS